MSLFSPPTSPQAPTPGASFAGSTSPVAAYYTNNNITTSNSSSGFRKRKADVQAPTESPLTKRFRKLNLREPSKVTKRVGSPARSTSLTNLHHSFKEPWSLAPPPFQRPASPPPAMDMDDTPHKIYVNDLDSSDDDSSEAGAAAASARKLAGGDGKNPIIFLSDVEREMTKIPWAVLKASASSSSSSSAASPAAVTKLPTARSGSGSSTDLILYKAPDKVVEDSPAKRLVFEARERLRSRGSTMEGIKSTSPLASASSSSLDITGETIGHLGSGFTDSPMSFLPVTPSNDPDAMVLDDL